MIVLPEDWKGNEDEEIEKLEFLFNLELVAHDGRPGYLLQLAGQPDGVVQQHLNFIIQNYPKLVVTRIDEKESRSNNQFLITREAPKLPVTEYGLGRYLGYLAPLPDDFGYETSGNYHVGVTINYSKVHSELQLFGYWGNESQRPMQELVPIFKAQMDKIRSILKPYAVKGVISVRSCHIDKTVL